MLETFIIDGNIVELEVLEKIFKAEVLDTTSFSDKWRNYIHSGRLLISLLINNDRNEEETLTFLLIGEKTGIAILRSIYDVKSKETII